MNEHAHTDGNGHHHDFDFNSPSTAAFIELEGEVLAGAVVEATAVLADLAARDGLAVRRVLDLGCGPGVGTCCLAQRFAGASVIAVDGSDAMLQHAIARAERLGLAQRVETRLVELPGDLSALGEPDIVWASMVLHHLGDEAAALRQIRGLLKPGGLVAVIERAGPLRVLVDDAAIGRPGIWERLDAAWAAWFADMRAGLPGATTSADYPSMLEDAGFELIADDVLTLELGAPLDAQARRFALRYLLHMQAKLGRHASAADLEALDMLVDERADEGIMRRDDVRVRATRHLHVGRAVR